MSKFFTLEVGRVIIIDKRLPILLNGDFIDRTIHNCQGYNMILVCIKSIRSTRAIRHSELRKRFEMRGM